MSAEFTHSLSIPADTCTSCGRKIEEGESAMVTIRAGSAWRDGYAVLEQGAELYTATIECPSCAPGPPRAA